MNVKTGNWQEGNSPGYFPQIRGQIFSVTGCEPYLQELLHPLEELHWITHVVTSSTSSIGLLRSTIDKHPRALNLLWQSYVRASNWTNPAVSDARLDGSDASRPEVTRSCARNKNNNKSWFGWGCRGKKTFHWLKIDRYHSPSSFKDQDPCFVNP